MTGNEPPTVLSSHSISLALNLGIFDSRRFHSSRSNGGVCVLAKCRPVGGQLVLGREKGGKIKEIGLRYCFFPARLFPLKIPEYKVEFEKSLPGFIRL